jgi:hypothetical protein
VRVPRAQFRRMVSVEPEIGEVILRLHLASNGPDPACGRRRHFGRQPPFE